MASTTITQARRPDSNADWQPIAAHWSCRSDTLYLNHGSFGLTPDVVLANRQHWTDRLDEQPMDFFLRQLEPALDLARRAMGRFLGTAPENLVLVDNATYAMNVVATSVKLSPGDEVLVNDHEYGAVLRIWERACQNAGAKLVIAKLPSEFQTADEVVDTLAAAATSKTRLLVISHITSATALIMPIEAICRAFRERGIAICIDGPHAPAQVELNLDHLGCDFYTASCHKWLCGPLGSGFLYVHPGQQATIQPPIKSWGRLLPAVPQRWDEEFPWLGTRDSAVCLALPAAIDFMGQIGWDAFRQRSRWLATYVEDGLVDRWGTRPLGRRSEGWYGSMAHVPLPAGDWSKLQHQLWEQFGIEVMVIEFQSRFFMRVSCHLYNNTQQLDILIQAAARLTG